MAAFIPAELCPDRLVAAGTLAELPARDLGHGRLLYVPALLRMLSPPRVVFRSPGGLPGEISGVCTGAGRPGGRHRHVAAIAVGQRVIPGRAAGPRPDAGRVWPCRARARRASAGAIAREAACGRQWDLRARAPCDPSEHSWRGPIRLMPPCGCRGLREQDGQLTARVLRPETWP